MSRVVAPVPVGPAEARLRRQLAGDIHLGTKQGGGDLWVSRADLTEHAHFLGPTGVGKTRLLQYVAEQLIDAGDASVLVLDPHDGPQPYGGLYHALKTHCYATHQVDRLLTIDLDEIDRHGLVTGFNPLTRGRSPAVRAALAAENLRAVAGITEAQQAVQLLKWSFNTFLGLHVGALPFRDAQAVLDADDPAYREVFADILAEKYKSAAGDWRRLTSDDSRNRSAQSVLDFELGSTKRRIDSYLSNEYVQLMLATQRFAFDPARAIQQKTVVLCNLSPRNVMDKETRRMLGTQLLHSYLRAAMDRPDPEAVPCYVIADEFHEFLCPEVLEILTGGRKFGVHLILAHQFLTQLQDVAKQDWRYLDAVLANPAVRVVFGGLRWADAEMLALEMRNQEIDLEKIKHELYGTVQTSHVEWMNLRTEMRAHATGSQFASGATHAAGSSTSRTTGSSWPADGSGAGSLNAAETAGMNFADAYNYATGGNSADMTGEGVALDVPVVLPDELKQELRGVTFWAKDEQIFLLARELKNQPKQHIAVYRRGGGTEFGRVANVDQPLLTISETWNIDRERLQAAAALPSPVVAPLQLIEEETRDRDRQFRQLLKPTARPVESGAARKRRTPDPKWIPLAKKEPKPKPEARTRKKPGKQDPDLTAPP